MARQNLLDQTYRLLDKSALTYREIAAGAGVDFNWFLKFKFRRIAEPGVSKVQAVFDFLSTEKDRIRSGNHAA
jgi:hypothetical protein